jgi:ribonuclease BN (tRNA processing enzyme)
MMAAAMASKRAHPDRKPVTVTMLGTGDAFSAGARSHSGYLIDAPGARVLLEAGPDVLRSLKRERIAPESIDVVLISHLHGDHFAGLVYLLLEYCYESPRATRLVVAGPRNLESRVRAAMRAMYPRLDWSPAERWLAWRVLAPGRAAAFGAVRVEAIRSPHTDFDVSLSLKIAAGGRTIVFTGDTAWNDELIPFSRGADLLLTECTFYDGGRGARHIRYTELAANRARFEVGRILLTHLGREMLQPSLKLDMELAFDGMRLAL